MTYELLHEGHACKSYIAQHACNAIILNQIQSLITGNYLLQTNRGDSSLSDEQSYFETPEAGNTLSLTVVLRNYAWHGKTCVQILA